MASEREVPLGDMSRDEFRRYGHALVDWIASYLSNSERYPVLARVKPGDVTDALPDTPPETGSSFDEIFADFERVVLPGITHWNHPGFFAYFAISGSGPRRACRVPHRRPQRASDAMADVTGRDRARGGHNGVAPAAHWSAGVVRGGHL